MRRVAIVSALPGELKPLLRGWRPCGRRTWSGHIGEAGILAVAGGMGAAAATPAAEQAVAEFHPDVIVSYGWAGALTPAAAPRRAYAVSSVVDDLTGERFLTGHPDGHCLVTLDHVARAGEKRVLAERHQAVLVDMEAASIARVAAKRHVAFSCMKGVSDGYADDLPDFSRFLNAQGGLEMGAFLAYIALHPHSWPSLKRLGQNSRRAADALAAMLNGDLQAGGTRNPLYIGGNDGRPDSL